MGNRYQNWNSSNKQPYLLHNKFIINNPGTVIRNKQDLGEVQVELKPGSEAPLGYIGKKDFPDWYKPYSFNYYGNGFLVVAFLSASFIAYCITEETLSKMGRDKIVNNYEENHLVSGFFFRKRLAKEVLVNEKTPMFNYTRRYIKESGF
jgi:hypothetical protein